MQFNRNRRRSPPTVIIVSLIDVLIVVLIFLMVTTTFKQQPAIKMNLPESSAQREGSATVKRLDISIETNGVVSIDNVPVTMEQLEVRLKAEIAKNPDVSVSLSADTKAPFGQWLKVSEAAKAAHVKSVDVLVDKAAAAN